MYLTSDNNLHLGKDKVTECSIKKKSVSFLDESEINVERGQGVSRSGISWLKDTQRKDKILDIIEE